MERTTILVTVEIPKGSRNKYEYDEELGAFRLDRILFSSVHYPTEYGFVRDTLSEDGDPLDALVIVGEPTFTGCVVEARPIALLKMRDEKGIDHKILSVAVGDPLWNWLGSIDDVPEHMLTEIEHFFVTYKDLEDKESHTAGWEDADAAWQVIAADRARFRAEGLTGSG